MIRIITGITVTIMVVAIMGTEGWQAVEGTGTITRMAGMRTAEIIGAQTGPLGKAEAVAVEVVVK
jgi:hypothetical protein